MRYELFNECLTMAKEIGAVKGFDSDPLNRRENTADFTTISEVFRSTVHDVQERVTGLLNETQYSLV